MSQCPAVLLGGNQFQIEAEAGHSNRTAGRSAWIIMMLRLHLPLLLLLLVFCSPCEHCVMCSCYYSAVPCDSALPRHQKLEGRLQPTECNLFQR
jgi:hypothetical protein